MPYNEKLDIYYLRLSKEDGDVESRAADESCSISSQRKCIHRYLKDRGFIPQEFEEIADDGYSGTNMNRPGIRRILKLVRAGRVRTIIVRDLSRFARNYIETGYYLEFEFPANGVRFISVNDNYDSEQYGENTAGLEISVNNLINQLYSLDLSQKIKSAVNIKKINGEYVYGTAPYGYKKGEKKNTIVVDSDAACVVRNIFNWAASGTTITEIARKLNRAGIKTPSAYLASVRGKYKTSKYWTFESVRNILMNRVYTGDTVPFKSHVIRVGSSRVKQIPEELQTVVPNTHEAIVSRELYYQAKQVVKSRKKIKGEPQNNPFTSLLVCSCCGNKLVKGKAQNKYWRCSTHRYTDATDCSKIKINESVLTNIVLRAITMQCRLLDEKISSMQKESALVKSAEQILISDTRALRKRVSHLEDCKIQLYEDYVDRKINKEQYIAEKEEISKNLESVKLQLTVSENKLLDYHNKINLSMRQIAESDAVTKYQEITDLTPELTGELIKQIIVRPDGSIKIEWKFTDGIAPLIATDSYAEYKAI